MVKGQLKKTLGNKGEELAVKYLKSKGLRILERNFRTTLGEIDIIAEEKGTIVFVEVKTRSDDSFGMPFEAVGNRKRERIKRIALLYLKDSGMERPVRFDVISIEMRGRDRRIEHIKEAF